MLAGRAAHTAQALVAHEEAAHEVARGGRKARRLVLDERGPEDAPG